VSSFDVDDYWTTTPGRVHDVRPAAVRFPRSQRRRKQNRSNVKSARRTTSTDAAVVDLDCFWLIFVAVDVAIVAFHLCRGYIDLQRLQRGPCRCSRAVGGLGSREMRNGDLTMTTMSGDTVESERTGLGLRLLPLTSDGAVPAVCNDARATAPTTANDYCASVHERESDVMTCRQQQRSGDVLQLRRRQSYVVVARTTLMLVGRIVRSRSLLLLLACAFTLAATHCVIRTCSRLTSPHFTLSSGGTLASVLATTVRFQTSTANAYLSEDTRHLDSAVLQFSSSSMTQDLHNLLGIVERFRQGPYALYICLVYKTFL